MTENWTGKAIVLRPEKMLFQGALVDAIRVALPAHPQVAAVAQAATPVNASAAAEELADDLPW